MINLLLAPSRDSFAPLRELPRIHAKAREIPAPGTRFHLVQDHGVDWLVRPDGRKLWSFGVCCIDQGADAKTYDPKNPGYAAYRYYPTPQMWAEDALARLGQWGFNTVGAWSDDARLQTPSAPEIVFTPILHIGSSAGAPWRDMWDPKVVQVMDDVARVQIQAHRGDPRVLGYFSDNEMGWWYGAMFDWAFRAGHASRGHLVDLFQKLYHGSWRALRQDFDPQGVTDFAALRTKGRLFLHPGRNGMRSVQAWMSVVSDRYYSLCRAIVKRYDPGALYLGDRYISNFYPEIARSAGRYCDVVSTNLNADDDHGDFARFYLPALHAATGRPIMITEYYVAAKENGSGNENNSSGFPVVDTQAERSRVFEMQTETFARTPYVVGAHWFQYYDEPRRGRGDGENYDMGLVDTSNRPYEELTRAAAKLNLGKLHGPSQAHVRTPIGLVFSDGLAGAKKAGDWLRNGLYVAPTGTSERADLYVGNDQNDLLVAVYWNEDRFGEAFYRDGRVPDIDRARLSLTVGGRALHVRIGDGRAGFVSGPASALTILSGVRNLVVIRVPGKFGGGLDATLETRGRAYRARWRLPTWERVK